MPAVVGGIELIGRQDELVLLDDALAGAETGRPSVVLVVGEAGVGKTTLVAEARRRAEAMGFVTASGGCADGSGDLPLAPLRAVLHGLDHGTGDAFRTVVAAHPDLATLTPGIEASATGPADPGRLYADLLAVLGEL
ncbi:hypothetical protein B7486_60780, partial [cyanobacterium TDX16]